MVKRQRLYPIHRLSNKIHILFRRNDGSQPRSKDRVVFHAEDSNRHSVFQVVLSLSA